MARSRRYPPASITAQWWGDDFARTTMPTVDKLLLHTTETSGWPAYAAGAKAPTLTYNPWIAAGRWRQHNWLNESARALQDPSSTAVRENRDNVVQVEIIAYCDPKLYAKYGHGVNKLPDSFYEDMGAFLAFLHTEWDVPLVKAPRWSTFPPPDSIRMTGAQYDAFRGVLGHQHASGNSHGDPGMTAGQVDRILAVAQKLIDPPKEMFTVGQYENLMQEIKNEGAATRKEIRRNAIWGELYEAQTVDDRLRAAQAFGTAYNAAKAAGQSELAAFDAGQKAAAETMQAITADLNQRQAKNG